MLELERAQVGVDLLGVVVAQLRIANVQRVKVELSGLYRHRLTAAGLLRQKLLLLERLALSRGALPRHAHIGWVGHGRDAPPPRALRGLCLVGVVKQTVSGEVCACIQRRRTGAERTEASKELRKASGGIDRRCDVARAHGHDLTRVLRL